MGVRRTLSLTLAGLVLALAGCAGATDSPRADPTPASTGPAATSVPTVPPGTGTPVPERLAFTAKTLDGKEFTGASLAGKPAVLWFWAPWCSQCRAAGPDVARTAQHITVVGVPGLSTDRASMNDFVTATKTSGFTHLGDGADDVWKRFAVTSQHTFVLIGSDGAVAYKGPLTAAELTQRVDTLK